MPRGGEAAIALPEGVVGYRFLDQRENKRERVRDKSLDLRISDLSTADRHMMAEAMSSVRRVLSRKTQL